MCRQVSSSTDYTAFARIRLLRSASVTTLTSRIPATAVVWLIAAVNLAVYVAAEAAGGSTNPRVLINYGAKVNVLIAHGEYWRLLTSAFLHIGITHLLFNMFALLSFGRMVELIFGHARFLAVYLLSAITGPLGSYLFSRSLSAGASGAIFGVAGALAMFYLWNRRVQAVAGQGQLGGLVLILIVNGIFGFVQPSIDNFAHAGGLLAGAVVGGALSPRIVWVFGPEGERIGLRKEYPPPINWLVVPFLLLPLGAVVAFIPGAGVR